jgi:hypothetical protein
MKREQSLRGNACLWRDTGSVSAVAFNDFGHSETEMEL